MLLRSRQRGQSVIEFGILALLFALMMFAIVEFGLLLNGWVSVSSTTREAARWAATGLVVAGTGPNEGVFEKVLHGTAPPGVDANTQLVAVSYEVSSTVTWTCTAPPYTGALNQCTSTGLGGLTADPRTFPLTTGPAAVPVGATVRVALIADKYEIITPLVRPIFGCDGSVTHCYIPVKSLNSMYYEGPR